MDIVNVARRFAFDEWGGTETVVWNTARELKRTGHAAEILSTTALAAVREEERDGITVRRFPYFYPHFPLSRTQRTALDKKGGNPYSLQLYRYLMNRPGTDLLHCHTMARMADTVRIVSQARGIPYVVSFHGGHYRVPEREVREMMKPLRHTVNYGKVLDMVLGNGRFIEAADGIIAVGYDEYRAVKERFPGKPSVYLPNGVDTGRFTGEPAVDFKERYGIPRNVPMVLCVSRIDYQKNQKMLVSFTRALARMNERIHLVLIGPVTAPRYLAELRELAADEGVERDVTVVPGLPPDSPELISAFTGADVFVLPSVHEPFGIVVLEAWAARLPVIASETGGLKKLVTHRKTGLLFDPSSLDGLVASYLLLKRDAGLRDAMAARARAEVTENYSWTTITSRLVAFYREVAGRKRTGRAGKGT